MNIKPIPHDGSALSHTAGSHTINLQRTIEDGFTLTVRSGPNTIDELTDQFTDEAMARHAACTVVKRLRAGESIHTLIADRLNADRDLIASIKETMAGATADYLAPLKAEADTIDQTAKPRNIGAFAHSRPNHRRPIRSRRRNLDELIAYTLSHADSHGRIVKGGGVTETMLRYLEAEGLGEIRLGGPKRRRFEVDRIELNARGRAAQVASEVAA